MTPTPCTTAPERLLAYWLGELDTDSEAGMDEHLLGCATCAARLGALVALGGGIRRVFLRGGLSLMLPTSFVAKVKEAGVSVREYEVAPGGSVNCTVTPRDDLVVAHLRVPLRDVERLDLVLEDPQGALRVSDLAFDRSAESLTAVTSVDYLRSLGRAQVRVRLLAVADGSEREIADYTFNHAPS